MAATANEESGTHLDRQLIGKYNTPVPRYTSYPTALKFCIIDDAESREALCRDSEDTSPLSLYFHLPFCRKLCWFCGCTKVISTQQKHADTYLNYLEKEVSMVQPYLGPNRKVVQLHFGGGSPNFLSSSQIDRLSKIIHSRFDFEENAELSVEIDPRTMTRKKAQAFGRLGINRASIGVQDVNPLVQNAINRIQNSETNKETIATLKKAGIGKFNVDLIYGLPRQTADSFSKTLDEVIRYDPDRIALFSYAHVPWNKPAQKILEQSSLPSANEKIDMLTLSVDRLKQADYAHIGMDHFTKANDSLAIAQRAKSLQRNFQGYSIHGNAQICGFGISAISQSRKSYRQNFKDLETYYAYIDEGKRPVERGYLLTKDDQVRRCVIMRLMCDMELDFEKMGADLDLDFKSYFASEIVRLQRLADDELIEIDNHSFKVTDIGRILIRNVASVFDSTSKPGNNGYSKAI